MSDEIDVYICPYCGGMNFVSICTCYSTYRFDIEDKKHHKQEEYCEDCETICEDDSTDMVWFKMSREYAVKIAGMSGKDRLRAVIELARKGEIKICDLSIEEFEELVSKHQ